MKVCVYTFGQNNCCGGATALFKLASMLVDAGQDCRVWQPGSHENSYGVPIADAEWLVDAWVIYPEVVQGNPLNGKHVVRWLLNSVGIIGGNRSTWGDNDIVVAYIPKFRSDEDNELLAVFEVWPEHIFPADGPRHGTCHAVKKGRHKTPLAETENSTLVYASPSQAGAIFRKYERFISYDSATWMSIQAAICGCLSIVVPDQGVTAAEWRASCPFFEYGIAYGLELKEVSRALQTMHLVGPHLEFMAELSRQQARRLVERMNSVHELSNSTSCQTTTDG